MGAFVIFLIILGSILGWFAMWAGVVALIGLGGWRTLAALFPAGGWPDGAESVTMTGQNGLIGNARYKGAIHTALTEAGLYLRPTPMFAINHPTLFIPWTAMGAVRHEGQDVYIELEGAPRLLLNGTAAPLIAQAATAAQGGLLSLEEETATEEAEVSSLRDIIRAKQQAD